MFKPRAASLALTLPLTLLACGAHAQVPQHALSNGVVEADVTEAIGGRLLSFSLAGKPNFLNLEVSAGDPGAVVTAQSTNVGYLGHEVWAGPQSQWWIHQRVNPERAAAKADWPPDPYLSLSKYTLTEQGPSAVALDSPASPVSGLQLSKRYSLVAGKPNSLKLDVSATNRRDQAVAWDIWFNTRTRGDTRVYVPVAAAADIRTKNVDGMRGAPLVYTLAEGIFSLDMVAPPAGKLARQGKVLLQPSHGWMAGFYGEQALIIQFEHQPRSAIHPEQGQVEFFNDYRPDAPSKGLLEMELHAPYVNLAPGQRMQASEHWTILPYSGALSRAAHLAFLRRHAAELGLQGL